MEAELLIEKYGVKQALNMLYEKYPYYIPKVLRNKTDYINTMKLIENIKILCNHNETKNECINYHKRDFGIVCIDCGKILN